MGTSYDTDAHRRASRGGHDMCRTLQQSLHVGGGQGTHPGNELAVQDIPLTLHMHGGQG